MHRKQPPDWFLISFLAWASIELFLLQTMFEHAIPEAKKLVWMLNDWTVLTQLSIGQWVLTVLLMLVMLCYGFMALLFTWVFAWAARKLRNRWLPGDANAAG
jgi:hypothetical protein